MVKGFSVCFFFFAVALFIFFFFSVFALDKFMF